MSFTECVDFSPIRIAFAVFFCENAQFFADGASMINPNNGFRNVHSPYIFCHLNFRHWSIFFGESQGQNRIRFNQIIFEKKIEFRIITFRC